MTSTPDYAALDVLAQATIAADDEKWRRWDEACAVEDAMGGTACITPSSQDYIDKVKLAHGYLALRKGVDYIELQKLIRKSGLTSLIQAKHIADAILSAFPQVGGKL